MIIYFFVYTHCKAIPEKVSHLFMKDLYQTRRKFHNLMNLSPFCPSNKGLLHKACFKNSCEGGKILVSQKSVEEEIQVVSTYNNQVNTNFNYDEI